MSDKDTKIVLKVLIHSHCFRLGQTGKNDHSGCSEQGSHESYMGHSPVRMRVKDIHRIPQRGGRWAKTGPGCLCCPILTQGRKFSAQFCGKY